jgi:tripartite-type tricarboxylate transporter receptor subunit TctC
MICPHAKGIGMPAKLALAVLIALASSALAAEPYHDHPITLIVPYAAGGSSDVLARLLGEPMSRSLGTPIVIDNRAGAGSRLGIELAAKAAPEATLFSSPTCRTPSSRPSRKACITIPSATSHRSA